MTLTSKSSSSTSWTIPGKGMSSYKTTHHFPIQSVSVVEGLDSMEGSADGEPILAVIVVKVNDEGSKHSQDFGCAQKQLRTLTDSLFLSSE